MTGMEFVLPRACPEIAKLPGVTVLKQHTILTKMALQELPKKGYDRSDGFWRAYGHEEGGSRFGWGRASIICDFAGNPLKPVEIYKRGDIANNRHAKFIGTGPGPLIEIIAERKRGKIQPCSIKVYLVLAHGWDTWNIVGEVGYRKTFPNQFSHLRRAIMVAFEKVQCQNCRDIHFAA